jgi:hypothetical protein
MVMNGQRDNTMRITQRFMKTVALAALAVLLLSVPSTLAGGIGTYNWSLREENNLGVSAQVTATDNGYGTPRA